ncbi:hypothetical protein [Isobaculum melis]|uniref:Uncharacterized protein n=1 Tax=Isobaculum melis TaxID=142588 RepID=A0A1H9TPH8_9LACT|nr:hypothetical protein [Isobaculum melis]SER99052.1 hypothetical protein SAMN04488559_11542 [Isobaculum melis]
MGVIEFFVELPKYIQWLMLAVIVLYALSVQSDLSILLKKAEKRENEKSFGSLGIPMGASIGKIKPLKERRIEEILSMLGVVENQIVVKELSEDIFTIITESKDLEVMFQPHDTTIIRMMCKKDYSDLLIKKKVDSTNEMDNT